MSQSFPENPDGVVTRRILFNLADEIMSIVLTTIDITSKNLEKQIFLKNERINQLEKRLAKLEEKP